MQISAPYYPYPLPLGAAIGQASGATGVGGAPSAPGWSSASGASTSATPCPDGSQCPGYPAASTYATVTITWAIA
jgi:hypothetical protein